ncbi:PIH1 domain-containing protein 2 [Rhinatrema bivittatum]|uniref:PIH1 domain-containing protein 2 n=1 Tax=Rhinatrema bivittatum TaxID=194408 RepID=UPI00112DE9F3|nr:PIH1 domain-containing protein 2 [Rhinatrema bivittatum]XP_029429448.1 PIH1 domain-containing protein 2 [Rhinatrema bivittatum]XP_029429449.1 PIH1 domain-containing protein 2 [Rhinatrema bivittatum]
MSIMEAKFPPKELLTQVEQLWSLLDDMAENNPESYQKFIQHHLQEAKEQLAPPEPHLCLQTKILEPTERPLFINICSWSRIPVPESDAHPVPLSAGKLEDVLKGSEFYSIITIAYNPELLKKADDDRREMDQLIQLAMKYTERTYKLTLCHSFHITAFTLKGSLKKMQASLKGMQTQAPVTKKKEDNVKEESLLQQLRNLKLHEEDQEERISPIWLAQEQHAHVPVKADLIEEISSTEQPGDGLNTPLYKLDVLKDEMGKSEKLELRVQLPGVSSVSECELSVSKDDVMIEVTAKYRLQLDLPETINEDAVKAKFNKGTRVLFITMPV